MVEQRLNWVDYAKGIGILLVVYGHLLRSGANAKLDIDQHFYKLSDSIVYSFHMPFFFFLIGLLVPASFERRGTRHFLLDKFSKFTYPYLVWSVIQASIKVFFSPIHQDYTIHDIFAIPYQPLDQFWFLYALMWRFVAYAVLIHFGKFATAIMATVALALFFYPINTDVAALYRFSTEFLFFVLGVIVKVYGKNIQNFFVPWWITGLLFVALIGSGIYVFENLLHPTRLIYGKHPYYFLYFSALGIPACIGLSQYCSTRKGFAFLRTLGTYSLQIYLVHMIAGVGTRTVLLEFFDVRNAAFHIGIGILVALVAPIILYKVSLRYNFPYLFHLRMN